MEVKQIANFINTAAHEMGAAESVVSENLDFVDNGSPLKTLMANDKTLDGFVKSLHEHVGKVEFADDRKYKPYSLGLKRDSWTYGGLLQKVYIDLPEASENETFDLVAGQKYDDILVYTPPKASEKYFDKVAPWDIKMSYADPEFVRRAFSNAVQVNGFMSAIENKIDTGKAFYTSITEHRTVNNLILEKAKGNKIINMLALYNAEGHTGEANALTVATAQHNKNYLRWLASKIALYSDFMALLTTKFNDGGYYRQTPKEYQKFFVLSEIARDIQVYSESDTYHNEFVKLIDYTPVSCWQGVKSNDTEFDFASCSKVIGKPSSGSENDITVNGVIGVLMDRDAAAVCNERYRVTSFFNAGNETLKYYHKWDARYITDTNENCIVFAMWDTNSQNTNTRTVKK